MTLSAGSQLRFGDDDELWTVVELTPPGPCAVQIGPQLCHWGDGSLLVLPSVDAPEASIFVASGRWCIDRGADVSEPECGDILQLESGWWRLLLPERPSEPEASTAQLALDLQLVELTFDVTPERIGLRLKQGNMEVRVPSRAALYTLLALARLRMESRASERDAGWISSSELADIRGSTPERINVDIHRLRKLFQEVGVHDAAHVIERDDAKRLRIGVRRLREVSG